MAKIKEIVKKLEDNSYERISLGATNVSELTNDSGFITNTVTNLTNYYTKSETYTQNEVKALIDAITTLNIEVVTELPTTDISATTIYLKGSETTGTNDYEEWIYANNDWEIIGTTAVDLSNYYNKTEADEQFAKLSLYGDTTINVGRKYNTSIGEYSTAEGYATTASGSHSHTEGYFTKATEQAAHAEGYQTEATGSCAHAEGNVSKATGMRSHAEGEHTTASGDYSHAEGGYTTASGKYSHAGGYHTVASKEGSYAEGFETQATGPRAHAEGDHTIASGNSAHAEGYNTTASGKYQHVQGRYNLEDSADTYAHIVGNGWSEANSNAYTLDWNGNAWFSGDVYIKSTSGTNKDEGSKKLITEEEVNNKIPTAVSQLINDSGYLTTVPDEYVTETELNAKGYLTEHQDISNLALKTEVPTKTSELTNDNGFTTEAYVNTKIANLVNSAPETLDTLGEVATAIQENETVVEALNAAIGNKADKTEIPNLSGYATEEYTNAKIAELKTYIDNALANAVFISKS